MGRKLFEILKKHFFEKKFSKKTFFFSKKRKMFFFKKIKFLFIGIKKIKCPLNCPFAKIRFFGFALQIQSLCGLPSTRYLSTKTPPPECFEIYPRIYCVALLPYLQENSRLINFISFTIQLFKIFDVLYPPSLPS